MEEQQTTKQKPAGQRGEKIEKFIFNSQTLVPWETAQKAFALKEAGDPDWKEPIRVLGDVHDTGYRFSPNEEVAELHNLNQKLVVRRVVRQRMECGKNADNTPKFRNRIVGIECYWWVDRNNDPVSE